MKKVFLPIIIVIISGTAFGAVFAFYKSQKSQEAQKAQIQASHQVPAEYPSAREQACVESGGVVGTASCCQSAEDFPDNCAIGACGCAPEYSHEVKFCGCGKGKCFDGKKCTANEGAEKPAATGVPEKFQKKINNLVFFAEDYPTKVQLKKAGLLGKKDVLLLGLYEGYHQSKRLDTGPVLPDRITLFQKPIESLCRTEEEIKNQIRKTVRHEIAHHFGSDEKGARRAG